jgi:cobyrinic acid a,c-diamide synthase
VSRHGFLIAAPGSGSGKTTVSLAIMAALTRRGLKVAPFKCGPDFIDPGYHRLVTGHSSINLDAWMCPEAFVRDTFCHYTDPADLAIIEGVMGLFDGLGSEAMNGSSAQIAALTGAPVVLTVNARGMAASAAAVVKGFAGFDPAVRVAGVIFNNVGSDSHAELLIEALAQHCPEVVCFGWFPRDEALVIPSRHLGLVTAEDNPLPEEFITRLADAAERHLDLEGLSKLEIPPCPPLLKGGENTVRQICQVLPVEKGSPEGISSVRIAVARDAAFCFCYDDNLRLLREAGAEICFFSPLTDGALPADCAGIYLPGGYPELYAERLSANEAMLSAIRAAVAADMPVYAECGGFVYLTEGLGASEGHIAADFSGVFPVRCRMLPRRKALGYRQIELAADSIIGAAGATARGHEFHYSEAAAMPENVERRYRVSRRGVHMGEEGFQRHNCLASYIHLHFGSNPALAPAFVAACQAFRQASH